jgi:uncharacterized HAD superfamily protein
MQVGFFITTKNWLQKEEMHCHELQITFVGS